MWDPYLNLVHSPKIGPQHPPLLATPTGYLIILHKLEMAVKLPFFVIIQKFFFGVAEASKMLISSYINIFGSGHFMAYIWKKHDFDGVDTTPKKQCFPRTKLSQICFASGQTWTFKMLFNKIFGRKMFEAINRFDNFFKNW